MFRGAPPDTNDYNDQMNFPPHQLMEATPTNLSSQPQYRPVPHPSAPQVWIRMRSKVRVLFENFQPQLTSLSEICTLREEIK